MATFALETAYRERLDEAAQRQYSAAVAGDNDRARQLRQSLAGDRSAIGAGAGRYVYPLPEETRAAGGSVGYVLKLAVPNDRGSQRDGKAQNRRETRLWRQTESRHLVPVVAADPEGYWLIMPRGERVHDTSGEFEAWTETVTDRLAAVWEPDVGARNVVILDGSFRLCDYGVAPMDG
jgi:hypothetical protein